MNNHSSLDTLRKECLKAEIQPGEHTWKKLDQMLGDDQNQQSKRFGYRLAAAAITCIFIAFLGWNVSQNFWFSDILRHQGGITLTHLEEESLLYSGPQLYQNAEMDRLRKAYTALAEQGQLRE